MSRIAFTRATVFGKGREAMTHGWAAHPQMWREVFRLAEDIGADNITLVKVKAHRKLEFATSNWDAFMIRGNRYADSFAKRGAAVHPHDSDMYAEIERSFQEACAIGKFAATVALEHAIRYPMPQFSKAVFGNDLRHGVSGWRPGQHIQALDCYGRWRCKRCLAISIRKLAGLGCHSSWQEQGHRVLTCGPYLFCVRCVSFSTARVVKLARKCPGGEGRTADPYTGRLVGQAVPLVDGVIQHTGIGSGMSWSELRTGVLELF